jgi:O-antigen/teichoic acid export membrane protein
MCLLLLIGYKAITMVIITSIFNIFTLLINLWYCLKKIKITLIFNKINWSFLKEVTTYSVWIFINYLANRLFWSSGQFILGIYAGTTSVAIFALSISLINYNLQTSYIVSVFLPKVTTLVTNKVENKEISDLFIRIGRLQNIVSLYILLIFILFGLNFILLWAGNDYYNSFWTTLILIVPVTIFIIQNIGIIILQAKNKMKFLSFTYLITSVFSLPISIYASKYYGEIGCAFSTAFMMIIGHIIIMNFYYKKYIGIDINKFWKEILKMNIMPLIFCIFAYIFLLKINLNSIIMLILCIIIFTFFYSLVIWKFSLNNYEKNLLLFFLEKKTDR